MSITSPTDRPVGGIDPKLLEILVCPLTKTTLEYDAEKQELVSRAAKLAYPIRDGHRLVGMIQPDPSHSDSAHPGPEDKPTLFKVGCVGRITQIAESGDGRYLLQLTGVARFRVEQELKVATAYRQCRVTYQPFADDFVARKGQEAVDRKAVLEALTSFLKANNLKTDWQGVESAPNEALVNALAMMSPYGAPEKQALLEAPDLKSRAEILVAITEMDLAKKTAGGGEPPLQ